MKIQDILFFLILGALVWKRRGWLPAVAIGCWLIAIVLFTGWIFFTAERLTWYGSAFILTWLLFRTDRSDRVQ